MRQNQNLRDEFDTGTEMRSTKFDDVQFWDDESYVAPSARSVIDNQQLRGERERLHMPTRQSRNRDIDRDRDQFRRRNNMQAAEEQRPNESNTFNIHAPLPTLSSTDENEEKKSPPACAVCCSVFSASGIVFLAGVSSALRNDNMYLLIEADHPKPYYASSVDGAIYLYVATLFISIIYWVRTYTAPAVDLPGGQRADSR